MSTIVCYHSHSQKSQGFTSGDLEGQAEGNFWLIILSALKWRRSKCFTQRAMCGGETSCINIVVVSHRLAWRVRIMDCCNNEAFRWLEKVHITLSVVWNECTAAISVTTESPACNFLQLDLLDPPTCIPAAIGYEATTRPWSIVIPSHLYPNLKET